MPRLRMRLRRSMKRPSGYIVTRPVEVDRCSGDRSPFWRAGCVDTPAQFGQLRLRNIHVKRVHSDVPTTRLLCNLRPGKRTKTVRRARCAEKTIADYRRVAETLLFPTPLDIKLS